MRLNTRTTRLVLVLIGVLLCFSPITMAETETETQTQTSSTFSGSSNYLQFSMLPSPVSASSYPQGHGSAEVQAEGTLLAVHFQAEGMAQGAHLTLVLVANGTSHSTANMTASYDGEVEAEATVSLPLGSYAIGLKVLDTSTFSSPTQVMVSSPTTQYLSLIQTTTVTSTTGTTTQPITTIQGGETEDDSIGTAIQTKVIPAVVDVGESGSAVYVNDANFSVSVGRYQQDGYLVSISAANVTGPRVLLVNLTSAQARNLFSNSFLVALDGSTVQQASTLAQVLGAKAGDPASFILISSPSALNLLILIPHFSYHTIEILPILAQAGAALLVDFPALVLAVLAVSFVVAVAYSRRTRVVV